MLTRKQTDLLLYINRRLQDDGISPSFDEMRDALGLKSKSGIHRLISGLEERGFIRRLPHRARALEVMRLPESAAVSSTAPKPVIAPVTSAVGRPPPPVANDVELPLYGRIAAGTPIEALRDPDTTVRVPMGMVGRGRHYALEVAGDSMVNAGILDGDTVIIQDGAQHQPGEIVVALVDREEVTLKYLHQRGAMVALEAANPRYETRLLEPDRVQVQGRLVGLLRFY
ncbi:MAG: transcriptional repressor LexA [Alphaproteobacteria bacterium]|nr:transcriptional repressor LexA [Alphaproteobacteria bacterium]MCB9928159.1 transcriptional repressor LexA [Alphaproteobacteria bacterium]